jgi:hypothetical protein
MRYYRKVIRITAECSPNVRLALKQKERGKEPTGEVLVPGLLTWDEYKKRRALWDEVQQCVGLDARFYKGPQAMLFPKEVLERSRKRARELGSVSRRAVAMGVDSAEGGDDVVWTVIDMLGIIFQLAIRIQDTSDIPGKTVGIMRDYKLSPEQVSFDRGGGGKEHADLLRRRGYDVRTVGFGESAKDPFQDRKTSLTKPSVSERVLRSDTFYAYKNRRAEMYYLASTMFARPQSFAVPGEYAETLRQLAVMPKLYDGEGRLFLPPKDRSNPNYTGPTIRKLLGRSPDHADSLVLAVYSVLRKKPVAVVRAF